MRRPGGESGLPDVQRHHFMTDLQKWELIHETMWGLDWHWFMEWLNNFSSLDEAYNAALAQRDGMTAT